MRKLERYPIKFSKYSSHSVIRGYIYCDTNDQSNYSLLDVGCSTGGLYDLLPKERIEYVGIEPHEADYLEGRSKNLNIMNMSVETALSRLTTKFDFIVFADVLEHLSKPTEVLTSIQHLQKSNSKILISVPNVAHFYVRLSLFFGNWRYTKRGILDETHLRFFTRRSILHAVKLSGYEITELTCTPIPLEPIAPRLPNWLFKILDEINFRITKIYPRLFAFQWVLIAQPIQTELFHLKKTNKK